MFVPIGNPDAQVFGLADIVRGMVVSGRAGGGQDRLGQRAVEQRRGLGPAIFQAFSQRLELIIGAAVEVAGSRNDQGFGGNGIGQIDQEFQPPPGRAAP